MADTSTSGILFTGEFDPSAFSKGIDDMVAAAKRMEAEEQRIQKELSETEAQLKDNQAALAKLAITQGQAIKGSTDYEAKMKSLATQTAALRKENDQLNQTVAKQKSELAAATKGVELITQKYGEAKKAVEDLNKEGGNLGANVSGTKLFGKLNEIKGRIAGTVGDIAKDISSGGDIGTSLSSLGSLFGVFGGAAVAALVPVILKIIELSKVESDAERQLRITNESLKSFAEGSARASTEVEVLKVKFDLARQGLLNKDEVLKEYNETLGKTLGVTKDFNEAEETMIANADTYIKIVGLKAQAQALANLRVEESTKKSKAELNLEDNRNLATKVFDYFSANEIIPGKEYEKTAASSRARFNTNIVNDADKTIEVISEKEIEVQTALANLLLPFKDKPKTFEDDAKKQTKVIENIYQRELLKLRENIEKLSASTFTSDETITNAINADFKKREAALTRALKKGQLTSGQLAILKENLNQLQDLTLDSDLDKFHKKREAFLQKLDDSITTAQLESDRKRIEILQDSFERERQTIEFESEKTAVAVKRQRDKMIADLIKDAPANGMTDAQVAEQVNTITLTYEELLNRLTVIKNQKLQKLSFDTFERLSEDAKRILDAGNLGASEGSAIKIKEQTDLYLQGKISYKKYQKELTEIARFEQRERLRLERLFLDAEIQARRDKLATDKTLTDSQIKQLEDEIMKLRARLASNTSSESKMDGENKKEGAVPDWLNEMVKYAQAVSNLANAVVGFWAQQNEAEQKALDRSIALQERRVESARRVAEKGNAEYLRLEEDRLKDLEVKRENAARRQLAINAALQASQVITALISGIAQGASIGGPLGALVGLTAVVGAIASGYAIAQSLKPQEPSFFVGTEDTGRPGNTVDDKGGFKAVLHPNERVMTAEQNKKLGKIKNDELVDTVIKYRLLTERWKSTPTPMHNLATMDMATNVSATSNIRLAAIMEDNAKKLDENNMLHRRTHHLLKNMGVSVNMDKHGLAVSVLEATDEIIKSKKI